MLRPCIHRCGLISTHIERIGRLFLNLLVLTAISAFHTSCFLYLHVVWRVSSCCRVWPYVAKRIWTITGTHLLRIWATINRRRLLIVVCTVVFTHRSRISFESLIMTAELVSWSRRLTRSRLSEVLLVLIHLLHAVIVARDWSLLSALELGVEIAWVSCRILLSTNTVLLTSISVVSRIPRWQQRTVTLRRWIVSLIFLSWLISLSVIGCMLSVKPVWVSSHVCL